MYEIRFMEVPSTNLFFNRPMGSGFEYGNPGRRRHLCFYLCANGGKPYQVVAIKCRERKYADETYKFECTASSILASGTLSKITFSEEGASCDGLFLETDSAGAVANQKLLGSQNRYVNGAKAQ